MSFSDRRHTHASQRVLLGALLGLGACSREAREDAAQVRRVSPGWGLTTQAVSAVIEGEHFLTLPTQHLGAEEQVTLESRFEVHLGERALEDVTWVDEHTLAIHVPAGLAPGWYPVTVLTPLGERVELPRAYYASDRPLASLRTAPRTGPTRMWVGEESRLSLTVENPGGTRALGVRARLLPREPGGVEVHSEPEPRDVEPGGHTTFTWTLGANTAGTARFTLELAGTEEQTGFGLSTALLEDGPEVEARARPASSLAVFPPVVSEGQPITLTVYVKNPGAGRLREVRTAPPLVEGGRVDWASVSEPSRLELGPQAEGVLLWQGVTRSAGELNFKVFLGGIDERTGDAVPPTESTPATLNVRTRGRLVTQFDALPTDIRAGDVFRIDILASNVGQSNVSHVQLEGGDLASPHAKTCKVTVAKSPSPTSVALLPGGGRTLFSGSLRALAPGECSFQVRTLGVDTVDGRPLASELATSVTMSISP